MKTYEVDVFRDGQFWSVRVPAVNRSTQARNLPEVDAMARDLIAIMEDVDPASFDLDVSVKVTDKALEHVEQAMRLRTISADANTAAAAEFRAAVREMVEVMGMTVRDVGSLLHISHQRVHQLAHDDAPAKAPARKAAGSKKTNRQVTRTTPSTTKTTFRPKAVPSVAQPKKAAPSLAAAARRR